MSCEKEAQAVQELQAEITSNQNDMKTADPNERHFLAGQTARLQAQLVVAQNALKVCEATVTGKVTPSYQLLFVIYAPPGTNGGKASSSVDYGEGSTLGSSTATSASFGSGWSISGSVGGGSIFANTTISAGVDIAETTTDNTSIDVKKSKSYDIKVQGPAADGIDHDLDLYYLCLKPVLVYTITKAPGGDHVKWGYDAASTPLQIQYVYGGWLKNPAKMPPNVQQKLASHGITPAEYPKILSANPFSSGGTAIDPKRFLPTEQMFPYEPPFSANDPVPTMTYVQKNDNTVAASTKTDHQTQVTVSVENKADFFGLFTASLKVGGKFTWTNSSTYGTSTQSSQSASVTIGGPSLGYTGPTDVVVYWDTLFSTFMFAFPTTPPIATGHVKDRAGHPVTGQEVKMIAGGQTLRTFTDSKGDYRLYGPAKGAGTLTVGGKTVQLTIDATAAKADLEL